MAPRTVVVIGGANGGPTAAARVREFDEAARIVLLEKRPHVSWVQAGLRHHLEGKVVRTTEVDRERDDFFAGRHRIEVRTRSEAVRIDVDARRVVVNGQHGAETLRFDAVIFSGGAYVERPDVPGLTGEGVVDFRSKDDLDGIRQALARGARRAVVLGAGATGLDAAEGLRAAGLEVDVVERAPRALPRWSLMLGRAATRALVAGGTRLHTGQRLVRVDAGAGDRGARRLVLSGGTTLEADLVVVAAGLRPRTALLAEAGAQLCADGSVRVDPHMQTTLPRVFACGTAVSVPHAVTRAPVWSPQAAIATRTAQIAGRSAAVAEGGVKDAMSPIAGTRLLHVGTTWFGSTGLSDAEARAVLGDDRVLTVTVHGYAAESWLAGNPLCARMIVDRKRQVVVGGEVWGKTGVARRIDLLAAAVLDGWSPARVADVDTAYAPTHGPAVDLVHTAGAVAALTLQGEACPLDAEAMTARLARGEPLLTVDVSRPGSSNGPWPAGTRSIPLEDLRERAASLPRDVPIVLVSQTGRRAYSGYRILRQLGFPLAMHLDGGALSWGLAQEV